MNVFQSSRSDSLDPSVQCPSILGYHIQLEERISLSPHIDIVQERPHYDYMNDKI